MGKNKSECIDNAPRGEHGEVAARRSVASRAVRTTATAAGSALLIWLLKVLLQYLQDSGARNAHARKARAAARKAAEEVSARAEAAKQAVRGGVSAVKEARADQAQVGTNARTNATKES